MNISFSVAMLLCVASLSAQTLRYQKFYGATGQDSHGSSVMATADGGYLVTGSQYTVSSMGSDVLALKLYPNGDTAWTRLYGDTAYEFGTSARQAGPGYVISASSTSPGLGGSDIFSITIDGNGDTIRTFLYGGTGDDGCLGGTGVGVTTEGSYIFAGQTNSYGAGLFDAYLFKTDYTGAVLWSHTYGGAFSEQGGSVIQTADSGFAWIGYTTSFGSGIVDVYLVRTDSSGNLLWSKCYGLSTSETAFNIIETSDGGFLISGMRQLTPSNYDALVIKTDSLGNMLWNKQYGGTGGNEWADCAMEVPTGGYLICGRTGSFGNGGEDILLIRTDANGDTLWTRAYGDFANDYAYSIIATGDGGYLICGGGVPPSTVRDHVYIIKTDANGWTGCNESFAPVTVTSLNLIQLTPNTLQNTGCSSMIPTWTIGSGISITGMCNSIGMTEVTNEGVEMFPSPASEFITIRLGNQVGIGARNKLIIINALGQEVQLIEEVNIETRIDVSGLAPGVYYCRFEGENGNIRIGKFLVQ